MYTVGVDKEKHLRELEVEIAENAALPLRPARLVFGEGNANAAVLFIGEAPGFHEDQQGRCLFRTEVQFLIGAQNEQQTF